MSKKISLCAMLIALAMIFSYVEALIPFNFGIPGIKLGIANLVIVVGLCFLKPQEVFLVSLLRIFLVGILFGNGVSLIYSIAGGMFSLAVMLLLKRLGGFSMLGISVAGGVAHNIAQLVAAMIVVSNWNLVYYLPALLIGGAITGTLIGITATKIWECLKIAGRSAPIKN